MISYLKIIRPLNGVMSAIAVYIAALISGAITLSALFAMPVLFAMLVVFLISGFGMIVNDIYDIEIDKINKPNRPLPSGKISMRNAKIYSIVLFLLGIVLAYLINIYAIGIALLASLLLYIYATKLKKTLLIGNIIVSILVGLTFIYGGVINMNVFPVLILAILSFLSNMGREIYKTCEDILGDKKAKANTIALKYGVIRAKSVGSLFIILAVAMSIIPFILGIFGVSYLIAVIVADLFFIASIFSPVIKSAKFVKIAMLISLIAFLLGAVVR